MANKALFDPDHSRTLFVLFPHNVKDQEELKKLLPGIETVRFSKRARRWCHIRFKTEQLAKQALKELHKKEIKYGKLLVTETKTRKNKLLEEKSRKPGFYKLLISNIPEGATKSDIKSAFKGCHSIHIKPSRKDKQIRKAIVSMWSFADAQDILANKESHKVNGAPVTIHLTKSVLDFLQNVKKMSTQKKNMNIIGRNDDSDGDISSENAGDVTENSSHVMQNYRTIIRRNSGEDIGGPVKQDSDSEDEEEGESGEEESDNSEDTEQS